MTERPEDRVGDSPPPVRPAGLPGPRRLAGHAVALIGPLLLTVLLLPLRDRLGVDTVLLLFVLVSVTASAVGGVLPALVASALGCGLANFFFTRPYGSLTVASTDELIDLLIFLAVAVVVGVVTEWGGRARARSEGAKVRAEWLAGLDARSEEPDSVEVALGEARALFAMNRAALVDATGHELAAWVPAGPGTRR